MKLVDVSTAIRRSRSVWAQWIAVGVWLFYLWSPLKALLSTDFSWQQVVGLLAFAVFVVMYVHLLAAIMQRDRGEVRWPLSRRFAYVAAMVVCVVLMAPGAGDTALTAAVFVTATAVAVLPSPYSYVVWAAVLVAVELAVRVVPGWSDNGNGLGVVLAGLAVSAFKIAGTQHDKRVLAEQELAELALKEERSRIARDLHDILGHSLTVLAIKAELAGRLLDVDVERARTELREIQDLSRDALADVRATAHGVRGMSLPTEIAAARSALDAAGIAADLPTVADEVPSRRRELFAWTIREGVTNVLRHSAASRCEVVMDADSVEILDDGAACTSADPGGHGLRGLRERAEAAGGTLEAGPRSDAAGFRVRLQVTT